VLLLDTWQRGELPAGDFAALVRLSLNTLYGWKKKFDAEGPAGRMEQPWGLHPTPDTTDTTTPERTGAPGLLQSDSTPTRPQ
jgi:hypothetical protein